MQIVLSSIPVAALFTYAVVVESGAEEEIKSGLSSLSGDKRYLALLIACASSFLMVRVL